MRELASAWLKNNHAKSHLGLLLAAEDLFSADGPAPFQFQQQEVADGEWTRVRLKIVRQPPDDLSLIAGDVASNMRAALDHAVFGLSKAKTRLNAFPIVASKKVYFDEKREKLLEGVDERFKEIVDRHQPFVGSSRRHPLALLQWFNNTDKHKLTHPGFTRPRSLAISTTPPDRVSEVEVVTPSLSGPVLDGVELCRFRRTGQDKNFKVRTTVTFSIGFGDRAIDAIDLNDIGVEIEGILGEFKRSEHKVGDGRGSTAGR